MVLLLLLLLLLLLVLLLLLARWQQWWCCCLFVALGWIFFMSFIEIFDTWNGLKFCDSSLWFVVSATMHWTDVSLVLVLGLSCMCCFICSSHAEQKKRNRTFFAMAFVRDYANRQIGDFHTGLHFSYAYCALSVVRSCDFSFSFFIFSHSLSHFHYSLLVFASVCTA